MSNIQIYKQNNLKVDRLPQDWKILPYEDDYFENESTASQFTWTVKTGADDKTTVTDVPSGSQYNSIGSNPKRRST